MPRARVPPSIPSWPLTQNDVRLLPSQYWVRLLPAESAKVLQVGANDHGEGGGRSSRQDVVQLAITLGWRALLIEPTSWAYTRLAAKYSANASIRTLQAAVCPYHPSKAQAAVGHGPHGCYDAASTFFYVDTSNATGNWGSNMSDARCVTSVRLDAFHWALEVGSFSKQHLLMHQTNMLSFTPGTCRTCSKLLGRAMPHNCLSKFISGNLRSTSVPCACLQHELALLGTPSLLFVDAEGHDDDVIGRYPFHSHPPWRVVWEPKWMSEVRCRAAGRRLRSHGYVCLEQMQTQNSTVDLGCSCRGGTSTWHLLNSTEPVNLTTKLWAAPNMTIKPNVTEVIFSL